MLSFLGFGSKKNTTQKNNEKEVLNRIAKEKRQRESNEAYRKAVETYHTMPIVLKNENVRYAKKKGVYNKYGVGKYPYLALPQYKLFEAELKTLRNANQKENTRRRENEARRFNEEMERLQEEAELNRRGSDPRPPSPYAGGKRKTRKVKRSRRVTRKH